MLQVMGGLVMHHQVSTWKTWNVSSPCSNDKILLPPEIRSFEKYYIGVVQTPVNTFLLVDRSKQSNIAT